jgi:hypothetical protein
MSKAYHYSYLYNPALRIKYILKKKKSEMKKIMTSECCWLICLNIFSILSFSSTVKNWAIYSKNEQNFAKKIVIFISDMWMLMIYKKWLIFEDIFYLLLVISTAKPLLKTQNSQQHTRESSTRILKAPQVQANWWSSLADWDRALHPRILLIASSESGGGCHWHWTRRPAFYIKGRVLHIANCKHWFNVVEWFQLDIIPWLIKNTSLWSLS